ncbi:MAG: hypothetical protein EPO35_04510 [Acidobacteria bacterium]|nr:MAG: hypothetical protein EPO35_04510 [Acidobacteriota bacterium]
MKVVCALAILASTLAPAVARAQTPAPPPPFVYSDGYKTRLKIHKISSKTFLPLVATQAVLGKMIYDNPTPTRRAWHRGVAWGIGGLFGVNTVTGTWNLIEARKDPEHRKRRVVHGLLMLASDAGFLATALNNPTNHGFNDPLGQRHLHRNLAIASISTASIGYLVMLLGHK